ncbi:MAG: ABC transporter permease [Coriobacteriia bacterium]|nr:ABC transporter permease [Coriobacteriia bacterium]
MWGGRVVLRVLKAELLKLRGSKAAWGTIAVVVSFALLTISLSRLFSGSAHVMWTDTLKLAPQFMAGWWGLLVFGLAAANLFGSEFSDGTAAGMFTTPIRREYFVVAKMLVLALWAAGLALTAVASQSLAALILGAEGFAWKLVFVCLGDNLLVAFLLYLTTPVVALVSMLGRGYIAPMLYSTGLISLSVTAGFLGWERWIPWAMPLTVAGGIAPPGVIDGSLSVGSWTLLVAFFVLGLAVVFVYVNRVDSSG